MTKILCICGKKQSGKNTIANWVAGLEMIKADIITDFNISPKGELLTPFSLDNEIKYEPFDFFRKDQGFVDWCTKSVFPFVKIYSFADTLKYHIAVKVFGFPLEYVYGSDEQKNWETYLEWNKLPPFLLKHLGYINVDGLYSSDFIEKYYDKKVTIRQFLQFMGTDIFRQIWPNIWVDSCLRQIKEDNSDLAIICDARFENEVRTVKELGGKVVKLTRDVYKNDGHSSENLNIDPSLFDIVLDNHNLNIEQQCSEMTKILQTWGWCEFNIG